MYSDEGLSMSLNENDIKHIAHLARLDIQEQEIPLHAEKLNQIMQFIEQLNEINTDHVEPLSHPLSFNQRLREDQVTETNQRELYQQCAPLVEEGLYLVNSVIE